MPKTRNKHTLNLLLMLVLVMGMMVATLVVAGADTKLARIGSVEYDTVEAALAVANANETVAVIADATLTADATVPTGVCLQISPSVTLTVPVGVTLTVNGSVDNDGSAPVHGTVNLSTGITAAAGDGAYQIYGDGVLQTSGTNYIAADGALALQDAASSLTLHANTDGGLDLAVAAGTLTVQGANGPDGYYLVGLNDLVTVPSGSTLIVGTTLRNSGLIKVNGALQVSAGGNLVSFYNAAHNQGQVARIDLGATATVTVNGTAAGLETAVAGTSYKWLPANLTANDTNGSWQPVVATNGSKQYASLAQAFLEAGHTDTLTVAADATLGSQSLLPGQSLVVNSGVALTLDAGAVLQVEGTLTVNGSLTAKYTAAAPAALAQIKFGAAASFGGGNGFDAPTSPLRNYIWKPTNAMADNGAGSWKLASLKVSNGTVSGVVGTALTAQSLTLTVSGDTFVSSTPADYGTAGNVSAWFNLPAGLTATVTAAAADSLTVSFSGKPTAAGAGKIAVSVPAAALTNGQALTGVENAAALWQVKPAVPAAVSQVTAASDTLTLKTAEPTNIPSNEFTVTLATVSALTGDEAWTTGTGAALALGRSYAGATDSVLSPATQYRIWSRVAAAGTAPSSDAVFANFYTLPDTPPLPTAAEATANSITLTATAGYEYMLAGGDWRDTVLFTGLNAASPYVFYQRVKAAGAVEASEETTATLYTAYAMPAAPAAASVTATAAVATVAAAEPSNVIGNEYTVTRATVTTLVGGEVWTPATGAELALSQSYAGTVASALAPATQYTLWVRVAQNGSIPASLPSSVSFWTLPATPAAPTVASVTADTITLTAVAGNEYRKGAEPWTDSPVFSGLNAATEYRFSQRVKAVENGAPASAVSPDLNVYTAAATPAATVSVTATDAMITVAADEATNVAANQYTLTLVTVTSLTGGEVWTAGTGAALTLSHSYLGAVASALTPATQYTLWVRVAANAPVPASAPAALSVWTLPTTPAAPTAASVTADSITLTAVTGCEYQLNGGAWVDDPAFTGLNASTEYSFCQRVKAADGAPASVSSPALTLYTAYETPAATAFSLAQTGVITFDPALYQVNTQADFLGQAIANGGVLPDGQACYIRHIASADPVIPASAALEFLPMAAYIDDGAISGTVGTALNSQTAVLLLTCASFVNETVADVSGWISDLPVGLSVSFTRDASNAHQGTLTFTGTPAVASNQTFTVIIPANQQNGGSALATEVNGARLWAILPAPPAADALTVNFLNETVSFASQYEVWDGMDTATARQLLNNGSVSAYIAPAGQTPQTLLIRVKATATADASLWTAVTIPARPAVIKPTIDFSKETYTVALNQIFSIAPTATLAPVLNQTGTGTEQAFTGNQIAGAGQATNRIFTQVKATLSQFASLLESVVIPARPATPAAKVDYVNETLTDLTPSTAYLVDNTAVTSSASGKLAIAESQLGTTISLKVAPAADSFASLAQSIKLAARPAAPKESLFTVTQPNSATDKGTIAGIAKTMEYSTDNGRTWNTGDGNKVSGLKPGDVLVRYAATATAPAGVSLSLTVIDFDAMAKISNGNITLAMGTWVKQGESILTIPDADLKTLLNASNGGVVTVDLVTLKEDVDTVTLPANLVNGLAGQAKVSGLLVELDSGYIQFDKDALDTLSAQAGKDGITVSINKLRESDLNNIQQTVVGSNPVWEILVSGDKGQIVTLNGWAKVTLYYGTVGDSLSLRSYYLDTQGRQQKLVNSYTNGWVSFSVNHASLFTISEEAMLTGWYCPYTDVSRGDWFYVYVRDLTMTGVVNGYPDATFRPYGAVTYGEALKLVLLASGYQPQANPVEHWAGGYLASAQAYSLIGQVEDLNAPISRSAIADLACKALHLSAPQNASTFSDTTDAAVRSLYEAGIVEGSFDGNGNRLYKPADSITRSEITTIIWRIEEYR